MEIKTLNIYQKIQEIRIELSKKAKKSGKNKFANYDYYELSDFLPMAIDLMKKNNLFHFISFDKEKATLTIVDCEKPDDKIIITSPMGTANLKGCHEIQNIGAVETYQRRYLYITAFELCENDALDSVTGKEHIQENNRTATISAPASTHYGNCPKCGKPLVLRSRKSDGNKFLGCSGYGDGCKFARALDSEPMPATNIIDPNEDVPF